MSIKSGRQFRSYIISWFLMIVGLIVAIGSTNIFQRAEAYLFENFNNNKISQLNSIAQLIDPRLHQQLDQVSKAKLPIFERLTNSFKAQALTQNQGITFSLNLNPDNETLTYGASYQRSPQEGLLVVSDLFKVLIVPKNEKLELVKLRLPGQPRITRPPQVELRFRNRPELVVNGQIILRILDIKNLTATYKEIKLNRWSKKAQVATINLPSAEEVTYRFVPKDGLLQPPGSLFYAEKGLKREILKRIVVGETAQISLDSQNLKADRYLVSPLFSEDKPLGAVVMHVFQETYHGISRELLQSVWLIFSLMSAAILLAAMFFARKITSPLEQLNLAITRLIKNDFNFKLPPKGFGSFKFLAEQFNQMLAHIQKSRGELIQLNKSYHRFVPHGLLKQLGVASVDEISLGDCCEREMTVLFCDIRGFTTLSESMTPQANFNFINRYLSQIAPVINKHGGIIDKYMGDGIMALFPNRADDAVKAAIEMLASLDKYNEKLRQKKLPIVEIGMGIHYGKMMLGTVGTTQRMDATVVSDTVNAAARVEALTKAFATKILITEETKRHLSDLTQYRLRYIAACQIRGKSKPVTLYEVFDNDTVSIQEEKAANQPTMIRAWKKYREGDIATAVALYRRQIEKSPNDKSLFALIERCQSGRL
ncbi:HAMP domain-containing protein [Aliikangiella marina]|uniref:HAMP domain-containing protein n=1 Tax=Aliikangiella marina TaxID=1712262 RepID=A0A545T1C1_9GAMM|nr:adenylate/guanylate cyclase domain-containing protein [Aliikangiella marina]TQV71010.1 HAMP domain-containing protein [Aliikangiella marina]